MARNARSWRLFGVDTVFVVLTIIQIVIAILQLRRK